MEYGTFTGKLTDEKDEKDVKGKICLNCGIKYDYNSFECNKNKNKKIHCNICKSCLTVLKCNNKKQGNMCKYILYMHPKKNTVEYIHLAQYWAKCRQHFIGIYSGNTASMYPFHISLTSWMNHETAEKIRIICRKEFSNMGKLADLKKFYYPKDQIDSSFLGVGFVSEILAKKMKKFEKFPVKNGIHLTLYYFSERIGSDIIIENNDKKNNIIKANKLLDLPPLDTWSDEFTIILWKTDNCLQWEIVEEF